MAEGESSRTALGVAARRAVHQLVDATPRILDDPVVLRLLDPAYLDRIAADPRHRSAPAKALRAHLLLRSRYAEDRLSKAVERGIRQYVLLGAGFDTFPYRQPDWAQPLRIFEVDQPATQREKQRRLQAAGIAIPANVAFVPVDFETTSLDDGLRASRFDPALPTFLSWLGVMMYLSQEAVDAVFRFVLSLPPGSEIAFSFAPPSDAEETDRPYASVAERAAQAGEPWKTRIAPDDLGQYLSQWAFQTSLSPPLLSLTPGTSAAARMACTPRRAAR